MKYEIKFGGFYIPTNQPQEGISHQRPPWNSNIYNRRLSEKTKLARGERWTILGPGSLKQLLSARGKKHPPVMGRGTVQIAETGSKPPVGTGIITGTCV